MIGNRRLGTALPVLLIFALLAAGDLASGGIIVKYYVHDMFVLFDAMWRGSLGQTPHIDFHTPIGQAYYWPFRLLGAFGDHDALSIIHAHVLVGALLTAGMLATLQRRLSPALLMAAAFTLLALAMTPRDIDHGITGYSWLAPYNRWSWAILLLAALVAALPPQRERRWIDGIVLGVAIALLFYMKLTFFVAAVGLVVVGLVLRQLAWPTALIALAVCLACALGVEATWHNHAAYLADLRMAFHASAGAQNRLGLYKLLRTVRLGAGFGMLVVAILWLWRPMLSPWRWLILWWKPLLLSAAIIGAGLFVTIQNHPNFEFAHGVIAVLVAIELARRRDPERPMAWRKGALVALAALAMILPAMDAASIFAHAIESRGNHICPVPALAGTPGAALLEPASPSGICSVAKAAPSADIATFDY
ncbi:MAG: hypothetical protein JWR77_187, partial [Rhizorhabdus sp.]|nr:hypothetical protein [Rhizorhabdus sp.]